MTIHANEQREVWSREFGAIRFSSVLSGNRLGGVTERFGMLSFHIALCENDGRLHFPVVSGQLFGFVPVPVILLPQSIASEFEDGQGRFNFDVLLCLRGGARLAHYRGWLKRMEK